MVRCLGTLEKMRSAVAQAIFADNLLHCGKASAIFYRAVLIMSLMINIESSMVSKVRYS